MVQLVFGGVKIFNIIKGYTALYCRHTYPILLCCVEFGPNPSIGLRDPSGAMVSGEIGRIDCWWCDIELLPVPSITDKERGCGLPSFDEGENFMTITKY